MADTRARWFLTVVGVVFLLGFGLPLLIAPYEWAGWFGWPDEPQTDVGAYFGRCLGAVAVAVSGTALLARRRPAEHRWLFGLLAASAALLAITHLRGLVENSQPLSEDLETAGYAAFAALALWCRPSPASQ